MSLNGYSVEGVLHQTFSVDSESGEDVEDFGVDVISTVGDDGDDDLGGGEVERREGIGKERRRGGRVGLVWEKGG